MISDSICTTRLQPEAADGRTSFRQLVRSDRARGARSGAVFHRRADRGRACSRAGAPALWAAGEGRRWHRERRRRGRPSAWQPDANADGHVRAARDRRAAGAARSAGRRHDGMEEPGVARLPAPHACGRGADRGCLSRRRQHTARPSRADGAVWRRCGQGHCEPDLAQGEGRLGRLERPLARRRADRAAHSRRHGGARAARPQGDRDLAAGAGVRTDGQKALLAVRSMGGESAEAWGTVLDDLHQARAAAARLPHRRRRGRARQGDRRRVGRRAGSTLHRAQASQSARPCARAPARRDHGRLHRHDLRGDAPRRSRRAARRSSANGGSSIAPSPTAWKRPATRNRGIKTITSAFGIEPKQMVTQ